VKSFYCAVSALLFVLLIFSDAFVCGQTTKLSATSTDPSTPTPSTVVASPIPVGTCSTTPLSSFLAATAKKPAPTVLSVSPASFYEGSILSLKVNGANLDPTWKILLCPNTLGDKVTVQPSAVSNATSTSTSLIATLTAPPGSFGAYAVYLADTTGKVYDSRQKVVINSSDDTKYVPCAGPDGIIPTNKNLQCSFSPLSYQVAYDVFGKGVAKKFLAVYVVVQNKNENLEFLLQDVRGGFAEYLVSSYDKQLPSAVATKEEQFSWRAVSIRLVAGGASIMTGVAGLAGNAILQTAANVFAGPFQAAFQSAIPDLSAAELNKINQLGFSVTSTVIPKGGAIAFIAFLPAEILAPPQTDCKKWLIRTKEPCKPGLAELEKYKGTDLRDLFRGVKLSVVGVHVQQINPSAAPTLKLLLNMPSFLADFSKGLTVTVQGTGLDTVTSVELVSSDGKTIIPLRLAALSNSPSSAIDPNVDILIVPATLPTVAANGTYLIKLVGSDGAVVDSGQSISIPTPAPSITLATYQAPASDGSVTVKLTGVGLNTVGAMAIFDFGTTSITSADGLSATVSIIPTPSTPAFSAAATHTVQLQIGTVAYTKMNLTLAP
jgi:hypothetical protein